MADTGPAVQPCVANLVDPVLHDLSPAAHKDIARPSAHALNLVQDP